MSLVESRARRDRAHRARAKRRVAAVFVLAITAYVALVWFMGGDPAYLADQAAAEQSSPGVSSSVSSVSSPSTESELRAQLALERAAHAATVRVLRQKLASRTSVSSALVLAATVTGVPVSQLRAVARCESELHPYAVGRTPVGSERAVGLMQFLPSTFRRTAFGRAGLSAFDPYVSAMAAASTVKREGWRQWACKP